jgi:hypothetical protein
LTVDTTVATAAGTSATTPLDQYFQSFNEVQAM